MKKLLIFICIAAVISACAGTSPAVSADESPFTYQFTAPEDFARTYYERNDEYFLYSLVFESDELGIWISYEDFDTGVIQLFSIEDKVAGKAFVYLSETGAEKRKAESKGTLLPGTKLHFGENDLAIGQVMAELYPAGDSGWIEGEPVMVKIVFSGIEGLPD
jgi:hypothetical protein